MNWVSRAGGTEQLLIREIGWANLPQNMLDESVLWTETKPHRTINEDAAIGVIALLLRDLEQIRIRRVVPIGNGGDYYLLLQDGAPSQVECSGIYTDEHGYESRSRVLKKLRQVLTTSTSGFAAVVTFCHTSTEEVHCYLHFTSTDGSGGAPPPSPPKKRPNSSFQDFVG